MGVVNSSGNAGIFLDQSGEAFIANVRFFGGEIFDTNVNSASAIKVASTSPIKVGNLKFSFQEAGYTTRDVLSDSVATVWTQDGYPPQLPITDGFAFGHNGACTVPRSPTLFPTGGLVYQSSMGTYLWCMTSDGVVHVVRTDTGPTEEWRFSTRQTIESTLQLTTLAAWRSGEQVGGN